MSTINFAIYAVIACSALYFGFAFVFGLVTRRPRPAAVVESAPVAPAIPAGQFCCNASPEDAAIVEAFLNRPKFVDNVVPFRRPIRPAVAMPTDWELIELAKSTDYPGAKKWSYSRRLSKATRASLMEVWKTVA